MSQFDQQGHNAFGQPVSRELGDWTTPPAPPKKALAGAWCRLEPMDPVVHASALHEAYAADEEGRNWTYMAYGPWPSAAAYRAWLEQSCCGDDPLFFAVRDATNGRCVGAGAFLRIDPAAGSIEIGHLAFAPAMQRTRASTETVYLMAHYAFELGYRRVEWKCDALNQPSRRAAERFGFRYEGTFRQAVHYKGRNRDTAWFAIVDREWPELQRRFERWLVPSNFDRQGRQLTRLGEAPAEESRRPELRFRAAARDDLPRLVALLAADPLGARREAPGLPLDAGYVRAFEAIAADPKNQLIVATDADDSVIGLLQLTVIPNLTYRGRPRALIEGVRIAEEQRSSGAGAALVRHAIELARGERCHLVQLTTDLSRPAALRFYERLGFRASHAGMKLDLTPSS